MIVTRLKQGAALLLMGLLVACMQPQPAPPPELGRYPVYFDEFSANLTPQARQVVADAARKAKEVGARAVRVEAHASATGSPAANQKLTETRAQVTYDQLQKDGVNPATVQQVSLGQTETGDASVADRRVDIVLLK